MLSCNKDMNKTDAEIEAEYRHAMGLDCVHITPKERKVKKAIALKGHDEKYWNKCTSRKLSGVIK